MGILNHLQQLRDGAGQWNSWREANPQLVPDLSGFDFSRPLATEHLAEHGQMYEDLDRAGRGLFRANLRNVNFSGAKMRGLFLRDTDLRSANLSAVDLSQADLRDSKLDEANLNGANLTEVDFCHATLRKAKLVKARLVRTDFFGADLSGADLRGANGVTVMFVGSNLSGANLEGCRVYGASVWKVKLAGAVQQNLVVTPEDEETITVDNLEVAQFIYLLLNNHEIRSAIDTITSKVVLILGRFTPERKTILDAIREELRKRDYLPVLFDFEKPGSKSTLETVSTLAHLARFVIADLTGAKSVLQELQAIVPMNPSVLVQPLLLDSQQEPGMFDFFRMFPWVLEPHLYQDQDSLLRSLVTDVIGPAEAKAKKLTQP